ncbi:MAG: hypothetical protein JW737_09310, partial [Acidobacteria bacterium]|nr:hypothetical protein [Acidobacteriota bacterium]
TNYNKDEFIKIFLANPGVETYRKNPCFRDNKVSFSVNNDLEGELRLGKINRFESVKFSPDKWNYANYFRRFELTLFKEAGMPEYSIKEGSETDLSLEIYRIARGLIKYKTVWKIDKRYLVLLMDGKDYEITISLYWSENLE